MLQEWKGVRHDHTVTWLAFWKDPISQKDFKYVWLAANSGFKSESDLMKYEKVRPAYVWHVSLSNMLIREFIVKILCFWGFKDCES